MHLEKIETFVVANPLPGTAGATSSSCA